MNRIGQRSIFVFTLAGAFALSACGKKQAPPSPPAAAPAPVSTPAPAPATTAVPAPVPMTSVVSVQLGNAVGADGLVTTQATTFAPKDHIYAVVQTNSNGNSNATLTAKWTYQDGQVVNTGTQKITSNGAGHTSFEIDKPDGFPAGKYTLEISLDGKVANTTSFEVK
ncbi:MAG: hypothetical protein WBV39_08745 [Rudaea sp.]